MIATVVLYLFFVGLPAATICIAGRQVVCLVRYRNDPERAKRYLIGRSHDEDREVESRESRLDRTMRELNMRIAQHEATQQEFDARVGEQLARMQASLDTQIAGRSIKDIERHTADLLSRLPRTNSTVLVNAMGTAIWDELVQISAEVERSPRLRRDFDKARQLAVLHLTTPELTKEQTGIEPPSLGLD